MSALRRPSPSCQICLDSEYPAETTHKQCGSKHFHATLDPIRCTLCVKPGGGRVLTSGQNQLFPSRGYIAETYAKVMGGSPPSQPRIKPKCTLFVC